MSAPTIDLPTGGVAPSGPSGRVYVSGEQDLSTIDALALRLRAAAVASSGPLELDLSGVTFMDASVVGVLCRAASSLRPDGRRLVVRSPSRQARRVLAICEAIGPLDLTVVEPPGVEFTVSA